jgi:hypothetical protein
VSAVRYVSLQIEVPAEVGDALLAEIVRQARHAALRAGAAEVFVSYPPASSGALRAASAAAAMARGAA